MKKYYPLLVLFSTFGVTVGQDCPPVDTIAVTSPKDDWVIPYWNDWGSVEAVTWNIEHFPKQDTAILSTAEVILDMMADIYAIQEVDDKTAFETQLMPLLPNYGYVLSAESEYTNLAILYRTDILQLQGVEELWADDSGIMYYFAYRPPLKVDFLWSCGDKTVEFSVINIHLKCCSSGLDRRRMSAELLQEYLLSEVAAGDSNFIVLGDWNDDLVDEPPYDAFTNFLDDTSNFYFTNLSLTEDPTNYYDSYPSWPSFLDHILITSALFGENKSGTVTTFRLDDIIGNYDAILSDHRPVGWKFPVGEMDPVPKIVINEIMQNPDVVTDANGEWFELYNADSVAVDLCNWIIKDVDYDSSIVGCFDYFWIYPGQYLVFGRNSDSSSNGGVHIDYEFSFTLGNTYDELILVSPDGIVVDSVAWDDGNTFPDPTGASMALIDPGLDNNIGSNWTASTQPYGEGDLGTPGEANSDVSIVNEIHVPHDIQLFQNYPNPFNPTTTLRYNLTEQVYVTLVVYDLLGHEVKRLVSSRMVSGYHTAVWDGTNNIGESVGVGVYLYRITANEFSQTNKMILLR